MTSSEKSWRAGEYPWLPALEGRSARYRVIVDNDFAGDPDGLYQLAHHLMSPATEITAVIGSRLADLPAIEPLGQSATAACDRAAELFGVLGLQSPELIVQGSNDGLVDLDQPVDSAGARAIVEEAMRDDSDRPLFVACGGGLTQIASAYLLEPRIADRLRVVWIGGPEYPGHAEPPPGVGLEYNVSIDPIAVQVVFNHSPLDVWQVPRNAYRQCVVGEIEFMSRVAPLGELGDYLWKSIWNTKQRFPQFGALGVDTFVLGDSPLVLLTALHSLFEPDPSSSEYVLTPAPTFDDRADMHANPSGRPIRVYTRLDTRLMLEDMFGKFAAFARWRSG